MESFAETLEINAISVASEQDKYPVWPLSRRDFMHLNTINKQLGPSSTVLIKLKDTIQNISQNYLPFIVQTLRRYFPKMQHQLIYT